MGAAPAVPRGPRAGALRGLRPSRPPLQVRASQRFRPLCIPASATRSSALLVSRVRHARASPATAPGAPRLPRPPRRRAASPASAGAPRLPRPPRATTDRPAGPALLPLRALARDQQPSPLVPAPATSRGEPLVPSRSRAPLVLTLLARARRASSAGYIPFGVPPYLTLSQDEPPTARGRTRILRPASRHRPGRRRGAGNPPPPGRGNGMAAAPHGRRTCRSRRSEFSSESDMHSSPPLPFVSRHPVGAAPAARARGAALAAPSLPQRAAPARARQPGPRLHAALAATAAAAAVPQTARKSENRLYQSNLCVRHKLTERSLLYLSFL
jgi:hypothetical protein